MEFWYFGKEKEWAYSRFLHEKIWLDGGPYTYSVAIMSANLKKVGTKGLKWGYKDYRPYFVLLFQRTITKLINTND